MITHFINALGTFFWALKTIFQLGSFLLPPYSKKKGQEIFLQGSITKAYNDFQREVWCNCTAPNATQDPVSSLWYCQNCKDLLMRGPHG